MFPFTGSSGISRKGYVPGRKYNESLENPSPLTAQYNLYNSAIDEDAENRDELWRGYRDFGNRITNQGNARGTMTPGRYIPGSYTPQPYKPPAAFTPNLNNAPQKFTPEAYKDPELYKPSQYGSPELYKPDSFDYTRGKDFNDAIENLRNLSSSGGYTEAGIADLRERGISPIRSIYANANRDIERGRTLSGGGTNASFTAAKSRMARELSDKIGGITTDVNANIAENVARNKVALAPVFAGVTGQESALKNQYGKANIDERNRAGMINTDRVNDTNRANTDLINNANGINADLINRLRQMNTGLFNDAGRYNLERGDRINERNTDLLNNAGLFNINNINDTNKANTDLANEGNRINTTLDNEGRRINFELPFRTSEFNRGMESEDNQNLFRSLEGMRSLFGTTPALSQLFGNQAMNSAGMQSGINQQNQNNGLQMIARLLQQFGGRR